MTPHDSSATRDSVTVPSIVVPDCCPFCGRGCIHDRVREIFRIQHTDGCYLGRYTVFGEIDDKTDAWNRRHNTGVTVPKPSAGSATVDGLVGGER